MSPPVTRARIVWLLLLRGAEGSKEASGWEVRVQGRCGF